MLKKLGALTLLSAVLAVGFVLPVWSTVLQLLTVTTLTATTGTITTLTVSTATLNGNLTVGGNVTLGNTAADSVTIPAQVNISSQVTITGGSLTVVAQPISVSSSATGLYPLRIRGMYSSTELSTLSANPGDLVLNVTLGTLCQSSATTAALPGAFILPRSTATTANKVPCY